MNKSFLAFKAPSAARISNLRSTTTRRPTPLLCPHQHARTRRMTIQAAAAAEPNVLPSAGPAMPTDALGPAAAAAPGGASAAAKAGLPVQQQQMVGTPSQAQVKTLYLIRHGEGWHNIGYERNMDAHLTPQGWAQTAALQQHLAALAPQLDMELVVVSPLRRTLETAAGVFGATAPPPPPPPPPPTAAAAAGAAAAAAAGHGGEGNDSSSTWVWMHPQESRGTEVTRRAMIYLPAAAAAIAAASSRPGMGSAAGGAADGGSDDLAPGQQQQQQQRQHVPLRIVAHEGCRERIGPNVCDKFRDIPLQAADFPGVDFSLVRHTTDEVWAAVSSAQALDGGCYSVGEAEAATEQRALEFYRWLMTRPESRIAVVSHCGFLVHGMRALARSMLSTWSDAMLQQCTTSSSGGNGSSTGLTGNSADVSTGSRQLLSDADGVMDMDIDSSTGTCKAEEAKPESDHVTNVLDGRLAEQLRVAAGEVCGRMSSDWGNCEMRSIQLTQLPAGALLGARGPAAAAGGGAAAAAAAGGPAGDASGGWLWATAGEGSTWWPGGATGI